jgi:glycosyltransferase involved in cell wall biosynthesis
MKIAVITTDFHPMMSSASVQLRDLVVELARLGHQPYLIVPAEGQGTTWVQDRVDGISVLRLRTFRMKNTSPFRRGMGEALMPFCMLWGLWRSPVVFTGWNAVVWYSPSAFFGPLIAMLKYRSSPRTYLILRDMFPEWLRDLGLLKPGLVYESFRAVARFQYALADVIGVQTKSNLAYLEQWKQHRGRRLEVLQNWLSEPPRDAGLINLGNTKLKGRTIFVYSGNMGVAQGLDMIFDLVWALRDSTQVGFVFVGRGSEVSRLRALIDAGPLENTLLYDEIDSGAIPSLLDQCHVGLLSLDVRHRSHNVPGKFLSYIRSGLPVLARINPETDLQELILKEAVGCVYSGESMLEFKEIALSLATSVELRRAMAEKGRELWRGMFSTTNAARQILDGVSRTPGKEGDVNFRHS